MENTLIGGEASGKQPTSEHGLTSLAWNDCPFEPGRLAVGGFSKRVVIYSVAESTLNEVQSIFLQFFMCNLSPSFFICAQECVITHNNPISDIAWAPAMGRSYHIIAVASRETKIKVKRL